MGELSSSNVQVPRGELDSPERRQDLAFCRAVNSYSGRLGVTLQTIYPLVSLAAIARQDPAPVVRVAPHAIGPVAKAGDLQSYRQKYRQ